MKRRRCSLKNLGTAKHFWDGRKFIPLARSSVCLWLVCLAGCLSPPATAPARRASTRTEPAVPIPLPEVSVAFMAERAIVSRAVAAAVAPASQVTLAFDAAPDETVTGYRLRYGTNTGVYTSSVTLGAATTSALSDLTAGQTYYFVAVSYDGSGMESLPSNEVSYTVPAAPPQYARLTHQHRIDQWLWPGPAGTLERSTNLTTVYVTITNTSGAVTNRPVLVQTNWQPLRAIASGESFLTTNLLAQEFYRVKH